MSLLATDITTFAAQLKQMYPGPWTGDDAKVRGVFNGVMRALSVAHGDMSVEAAYVGLQNRLATATDSNVEAIAKDFLTLVFPRFTLVTGVQGVLETDRQYATRVKNQIIGLENTVASIQKAVTTYLNTGYQYEIAIKAQVLGLDSRGSIDGWGALDGRSSTTPPIPLVSVFDKQSDPVRSARLNVGDGQFAIILSYGLVVQDGFFLGGSTATNSNSHLGAETYLVTPGYFPIPPPTSYLAALVESIKAAGCKPLWFDNNA